MARKTEKKKAVAEREPATAPVFTPCRQCAYPADCERMAKCIKGFK